MCSRKCKTNQLAKSGSSVSISFPLTLKKSKSSFVNYIDDSDSENEECDEAAASTSSESDDAAAGPLRRSHSLRRRESLHKQRENDRKPTNITPHRSSFLRPQETDSEDHNQQVIPQEGRQGENAHERPSGDDLADELTKLSKKLQEIESRLVKNERRTDKELRKLNSRRQKESKEAHATSRGSEKGATGLPLSTGFAGLKRSATDFFRIKSRLRSSASVVDCRGGETRVGGGNEPGFAAQGSHRTPEAGSSKNRQSFSQRLHKSSSSVLRAAASVIRPHLKSEKKAQEYSSIDSVNNCSMNSSTGSKNKLSSVSATSLSAEEEAFEQCYQQRFRRSPLRAFVDEKIFRRRLGPPLRDSLDSSASGVGSRHGNNSWDSDSGNPYPGSMDHFLNHDDGTSSQSRASVSDEVFETDAKHVRANTTRLPPTPDGKKARKYRAYSTPNTQQVVSSNKSRPTPTLTVPDHEPEAQTDGGSGTRAAITPDILAEIEMYRYMAFQRAAKGFQTRNKLQ